MMMTSIDNHPMNHTNSVDGGGINGDPVSVVDPIEVSRSSATTTTTTTNGDYHAFDFVAQLAGICLHQSHFRRKSMNPHNDRIWSPIGSMTRRPNYYNMPWIA